MAARVHRPLEVITFNANGIWRQRYKLSIQLQDLHIRVDVALLSDTSQIPREVLYSKLSLLSDWPLPMKKRRLPLQ
jgi:hypothetical protein